MSSFNIDSRSDEVGEKLKDQIKGKTVLITGTSPRSIAAEAARVICAKGASLLISAIRNREFNEQTKASILKETPTANIRLLDLDLASQESVRKAAAEVNGYEENIDVVINSAGVMAAPYRKTVEGIESQFGICHIGHFLLVNLILCKINDGGRIVNVTSWGHNLGAVRYDDPNFEKGPYEKWPAYGQAKTANVLFSQSLAKKLSSRGITSFSPHPGPTNTNLSRDTTEEDRELFKTIPNFAYKSIEQSGATYLVAAFDPSLRESNGAYMENCQVKEIEAPWAKGDENAERLWALSEKLVGQTF